MTTTTTDTKIEIKLTDEQLRNLLCCAFEGGSNYWYVITGYIYPPGRDADSYTMKDEVPRYMYVSLQEGGAVKIRTLENDEINGAKEWLLNRAAIMRGLEILRDKIPRQFANVISGNDDADTGDCLLQCALFGEIVFG